MRNPAPFLPDSLDWHGVRHDNEEKEDETARKTRKPTKSYRTTAQRRRAGKHGAINR